MEYQVAIFLIAVCACATSARAQSGSETGGNGAAAASLPGWARCAALKDDAPARLACFDGWVQAQPADPLAPVPVPVPAAASVSPPASVSAALSALATAATARDCTSPAATPLSRFWELESASDCGNFGIRGYRPISLSWIGSDGANTAPASAASGHTAAVTAYSSAETRIALSVRTKIASGLLTAGNPSARDSLWFGYSQQSYWQLFSAELSRPFRTTDHEPELTYIFPADAPLPLGWRLRYMGLSLNHQSNGQGLPLSRSWNRSIFVAGMEKGAALRVQARVWRRLPEDQADDDNPGITDYVGRAELSGLWDVSREHTLGVTLRHSLQSSANGSLRLEWLRTLGDPRVNGASSGLRFHTQLFTGYGDSLVDFNRQRTVLSVGLSLVDW